MEQQEQEMPYAGELKTAYEITEVVGKEQRILVTDLYPQINSKNLPTKSHSKRLAEFLGLIHSSGSYIEITDMGRIFIAHRGEEERNKLLAKNLPKKYQTILRWIKNNEEGSMELSELKTRIVQNKMENKTNNRAYDWILQVFGNFASSIGIITYIKGKNSKFIITELGKKALQNEVNFQPNREETQDSKIVTEKQENQEPELDGEYPVLIMTKYKKPLDIEISDEVDWEIVDSYIKSLKSNWNKIKELKNEKNI